MSVRPPDAAVSSRVYCLLSTLLSCQMSSLKSVKYISYYCILYMFIYSSRNYFVECVILYSDKERPFYCTVPGERIQISSQQTILVRRHCSYFCLSHSDQPPLLHCPQHSTLVASKKKNNKQNNNKDAFNYEISKKNSNKHTTNHGASTETRWIVVLCNTHCNILLDERIARQSSGIIILRNSEKSEKTTIVVVVVVVVTIVAVLGRIHSQHGRRRTTRGVG